MPIARMTGPPVLGRGRLCRGDVPTDARTEEAGAHIDNHDPRPNLVVVTGDSPDHGAAGEYAILRQILGSAGGEGRDRRSVARTPWLSPYPTAHLLGVGPLKYRCHRALMRGHTVLFMTSAAGITSRRRATAPAAQVTRSPAHAETSASTRIEPREMLPTDAPGGQRRVDRRPWRA
jgi:hypothetical protein